jgi:hypothetical protein
VTASSDEDHLPRSNLKVIHMVKSIRDWIMTIPDYASARQVGTALRLLMTIPDYASARHVGQRSACRKRSFSTLSVDY